MVSMLGWFREPASNVADSNGVSSSGEGSLPPTSTGDNNNSGSPPAADNLTCHQEFEYFAGQGMPTKEDNLKSILRGASMDDFITKVACNTTEICKWAIGGTYGHGTEFPSVNGTLCVTAGGAPDNANYNQLMIVRPNDLYDLAGGTCKNAVQSILNDCILSGKYYGGTFLGGRWANFPRSPTLDNGFANANIPNDVVSSALEGPAPTTTTFQPATPFPTVTRIYV